MDTLLVSHRSALARWAERGLAQRLGGPCEPPRDWTPPSAAAIGRELLVGTRLEATPGRPLHIMVPDRALRVRAPYVVSHVWSAPLPAGSVYRLAPDVLLASPQLCLRQICAGSGIAEAASAVMEVCGGYALSAGAQRGFHQRPPLATVEGLRAEFADAHDYGSRRVREALEHAVGGSRSPMETAVILFFTLPEELGGCGLPMPQVNVRVEISSDLRGSLGKPYLVVDLCWPDQGIIIEYDSYTWHLGPREFDGTQSRNEALRDEGWMVRTVTAGILADPGLRGMLVTRVLRGFGRRVPDDPAYESRQRALVEELLAVRGA